MAVEEVACTDRNARAREIKSIHVITKQSKNNKSCIERTYLLGRSKGSGGGNNGGKDSELHVCFFVSIDSTYEHNNR